MKARLMLAIPLMAGVALAQSAQSGSQSSSQPGSQGDRQSGSQAGAQSGSSSGPQSSSTSGSSGVAEMKTTTYRGTLVGLSCGSATASTAAGSLDTNSTNTASAAAGQSGSNPSSLSSTNASSANRSAGDMSNCPLTSSSSQFGLKMDNGQVVRFDLVGNQRAQDELKNNKKWTSAVTSSKPITVKISGVMQGDKLIVSSIH